MKKKLSTLDVQKIDELNNKLIAIEERIYNLAKKEYQIAEKEFRRRKKIEDIIDYELDVKITFDVQDDFFEDTKDLVSWQEFFKYSFNAGRTPHINDKQCHNVSGSLIKNRALNIQKHCWLLHRLYDDFYVSWDDILRIETMWINVAVRYQYEIELG